jgi:ethanolamine utilization protein EutN
MTLGEVIGTVTSTAKHPSYVGHKLMVVQPISKTGKPVGNIILAVDTVQAGVHDRVLVMREGNGVRQILGGKTLPIRSLIVGIVDQVDAV